MHLEKELKEMIKTVRSYVELELASGVSEYVKTGRYGRAGEMVQGDSRESSLEAVEMEALSCKRCSLAASRTNAVFGSGNMKAQLMFIGEAPGRDEDLQGLPFVGRAGALLTKIIEAMGLKRKDVYIANIVKCRPPDNRNPLPTEMLACEEYLTKQIGVIKPRVICALGKVSAQALLKTQEPISKLRGVFHEYHGIKFMPTYHPAYLLRNPDDKKLVWQDMKKIMACLKGEE